MKRTSLWLSIVLFVGGDSIFSVESFASHQIPTSLANSWTTLDLNMSRRPTEVSETKTTTATKRPQEPPQRKTWNPLRLAVLRLGFTEPAMTSPLNYGKFDGEFSCAYCGAPLFDSSAKYDSGSGWPSFWRTISDGALSYKREFGSRLECKCQNCDSHLGHVFLDGPQPASVDPKLLETSPESDPRGRINTYLPRFCINGAALRFAERDEAQ